MDKDKGVSKKGKEKLKEKYRTITQKHLLDFKNTGYEEGPK